MDYYGVLEINRSATDEDIKKAYRKLALKYHPKREKETDTSQEFSEIAEAYDVLSSPKWKILFDQFEENGIKDGVPVPPVGNEPEGPIETYVFHGDPMKVFRDFFGVDNPFADFFLPNLDPAHRFFETPAKPVPGPDLELALKLSLGEAYYGCIKTVAVPLRVVDESGTKTVDEVKSFTFRVPKGTQDGHLFHFNAAGTSGPNILPGNVTFRAEIQPDPQYRLEDSNIVTCKTLYLGHALTGCTVDVTTFDGKTIHIPISDVIQPGYRITLKGEGMPIIGFATKGDFVIEFDVTFPEKLSRKQKELIREALIKSNV